MRSPDAHPDSKRDQAAAATRAVMLPEILDVSDLSRWLRCSPATSRRLLRDGVVPGKRIGRRWFVTRDALLTKLRPADQRPRPRVLRAADDRGASGELDE